MCKKNIGMKKWIAVPCTLLLTSSLFAGCSATHNSISTKAAKATESEAIDQQTAADENDIQLSNQILNSAQAAPDTWNDATATHIVLDNTTANITGDGAAIAEKVITISASGTYVVTGTLTDGQLCIDAGDEDDVHLVLNQTAITCSDNAPIYCANANELVITLADGSENILTDGTSYTFQSSKEDEPDAAIFSHDDLIINGSGKLTVTGNYQKGIRSKDDLIITNGTICVTSVDDAISGKDGLVISDGDFVIKAGEDALKSSNDEEEDKGDLHISGGTFTIDAGDDAIHAEKNLIIDDGTINIQSSTEALEGMTVTVNGGDINLTSSDDGINAAGTGLAEDDATEEITDNNIASGIAGDETAPEIANNDTAPKKASNDAAKSATAPRAGKQGMTPPSFDGDTMAPDGGQTPPDFGGGAMAPDGGQQTPPDFGGDMGGMDAATDYNYIRITGGNITMNAGGDGIDTNGNLYVDGGSTLIYGPTNDGNGLIDYAGSFEITGGTFVAAGSSGMAQTPSESSTQASLLVYFDTEQKAGTTVTLTDDSGNTVVSITPEKSYQCILVSSPDMTQTASYTVKSGDTELFNITLESITTSVSQDGTNISGGTSAPGGMQNMMPPGRSGKQSQ